MSELAIPQRRVALRDLFTRQALTSDTALLIYLAGVSFIAHVLVGGNYGYFRDELYYLAGGRHLAFGYVDFPPMIAFLAAVMNVVAGDALFAIHIVSALAGACVVVVTGLMARTLGGGRFAQLFAALASAATLVFMATASIFSMDVLDELWWALCAYLIMRLIRRDQPRLWLLVGVVVGLGLLTKLTMLFFGFALLAGLLLTPQRRYLRTRWPWLGFAIAAVLALPFVLWNAANGWPTVEFYHHYGGLSGGGVLGFLANQILSMNPLNVPLALAGLYFYFGTPQGKPYRALGWVYAVLYVLFTLINAKAYFLAPAYPILFAGGALVVERVIQQARWRWVRPVYPAALALAALFLAPVAMPILPPATYVAHYSFLTATGNGGAGQANAGQFPQYLGDRFGWDSMTTTVAHVYESLPASQRAQACIFTANYGEAAALNLLGTPYHLPPVVSGHNSYYLWGPGSCSGAVIITVDMTSQQDQQTYANVVPAATITCQYCMTVEDNLPVYVCTGLKLPIRDAWQRAKHYD